MQNFNGDIRLEEAHESRLVEELRMHKRIAQYIIKETNVFQIYEDLQVPQEHYVQVIYSPGWQSGFGYRGMVEEDHKCDETEPCPECASQRGLFGYPGRTKGPAHRDT